MSDQDRVKMGERLKEAREYLGFSQEEVANHLGISRSAISLIESGKRKIESIELSKLSKLYNKPTDVLTGEAKEKRDKSLEKVEIIQRAIKELGDNDKDEVLKFAEFLKSRSKMRGK